MYSRWYKAIKFDQSVEIVCLQYIGRAGQVNISKILNVDSFLKVMSEFQPPPPLSQLRAKGGGGFIHGL